MTSPDWQAAQTALRELISKKLGDTESCLDMLEIYDELMVAIWSFLSRLLGDAGARAVFSRSIQLASADAPLLQHIDVRDEQLDFAKYRELIAAAGCTTSDLSTAFLRLGEAILQTLSEITGNTVMAPLLERLAEDDPV